MPGPTAGRGPRGQILVIVAGGLIGLLAIAAFALEGGTIVLNRRDAQNASDLAAVAGARIVALKYTDTSRTWSQADVRDALTSSMTVNGCANPAPCTWTANFVGSGLAQLGQVGTGGSIPGGAVGVRVQVTRTPGALLGRMLGFPNWPVSTEGTAISTKAATIATGTMLPIAMCGWRNDLSNDCVQANSSPSNALDFQPGQIYDLTDGKDAPGGFGWLSWTGSNSGGALATSVCTPNNPGFTLDSPYDDPNSSGEVWFPVDPGKSNKGSVRNCLDQWIARGTTVLVPIYDLVTGNGNNAAYHITGVAAFVLTSRDQPAVDNIQGYFVEYVPYSGNPAAGTLPPDAGDTTIFIGLVK